MLALETQMLHRSLRECLAVPTMASIIQSDIPFSCKLRLFQTMFDWIFTLSQMECVILTDIQQCRCSCQSSLTDERRFCALLTLFDLLHPLIPLSMLTLSTKASTNFCFFKCSNLSTFYYLLSTNCN